jgi:D-xylose transport system substrate-binding protein
VTKSNIEDTVIADGIYQLSDICTPKYAADRAAIGLKK